MLKKFNTAILPAVATVAIALASHVEAAGPADVPTDKRSNYGSALNDDSENKEKLETSTGTIVDKQHPDQKNKLNKLESDKSAQERTNTGTRGY